jgi:hypothetical protein
MKSHPIVVEATAFMDLMSAGAAMGYRPPKISENLARLLGCPYTQDAGGSGTFHRNLEPNDPETTAARKFILPTFFAVVERHGQHPDRLSVLVALNRSKGWVTVLEDLPLAYELAQALVAYVDCHTTRFPMYNFTSRDVLHLLNAWLKPSATWVELPGVRTLCRHIFGDAWCAIALPETYADEVGSKSAQMNSGVSVHNFIAAQKPPFLDGLCQAQDAASSLDQDVGIVLPDMAC